MYNCARCHRQVLLCQYCDHGHIYCFDGCAEIARRESQRRASRRYGATRRGRQANAERQRRFRERQREKVTHQGTGVGRAFAVVLLTLCLRGNASPRSCALPRAGMVCHHCRRRCSAFVRRHWLHQHRGADAGDLQTLGCPLIEDETIGDQ
jgi:hypothetical protein